MKKSLKRIVRWLCIKLQIPITKNIEYDILTEKILKTVLSKDSNCVDVGAHKGEILDLLLKYAKDGKHFAFEPIPYLFEELRKKYDNEVSVYRYALSTYHGETEFNLVLDDPAYSGIKQRKYKSANTQVETIKVQVRTLDEIVTTVPYKIDLIKIDVEGGEFDVLKGGSQVLKDHKPFLIFECGKGASDYYGTKPGDIYDYLIGFNYSLNSLKGFSKYSNRLSKEEFIDLFDTGEEYYFVGKIDNRLC